MPIVSLSSPLPQETEHNRSFRTHAACQSAFRALALGGRANSRQRNLPDLAHRALTAYGTNIIARPPGTDFDSVRACVHRAWGTETILCVTVELSPGADLTRLALAWGSVQIYYYAVLATLVACRPLGRPQVQPRALVAGSHRTGRAPGVCQRLPQRAWSRTEHECASMGRTSARRGVGSSWQGASFDQRRTCQETMQKARDQKKRDRIRAWKDEEAKRLANSESPRKVPATPLPRLTPVEKQSAQRGVRPFTLLDYLFRLRIKANYIDVDVFSQGPETDHAAEAFALGMQDLVTTTLLVHELRLGKLLGPTWVLREANAWLAAHAGVPSWSGLSTRQGILADA